MNLKKHLNSCGVNPHDIYQTPDGKWTIKFHVTDDDGMRAFAQTGLQVVGWFRLDNLVCYRVANWR